MFQDAGVQVSHQRYKETDPVKQSALNLECDPMHNDLFSTPPSRTVLTVTQLNRQARQLLETHLSLLWVEGEVSNFSAPSSGHWYFTLKDKDAQIRCAMFRSRSSLVRFKPDLGKHVVVRGRVSLYENRGDYQLIVEHMEEAGFGVLQRAFEALKNKLQAEGLFDAGHKKAIPTLPRHIAVITSPTGAAIHDILTVLKRRFPSIPVTIIPVAVQGEGSARQIVKALELANRADMFDVILLARGGGSLEDLWPFNEEIVARAIYQSALPVVSGIGHEVDITIADFVADARAATPSAAAEMLSPDSRDWQQAFARLELALARAMLRRLERTGESLKGLTARLRHPGERLRHQAQHLDHLEMRLQRCMNHRLHLAQQRHANLATRHQRCQPNSLIVQLKKRLEQASRYLMHCGQQEIDRRQQRLSRLAELLDTVSPLKTVQRGYSLTLSAEGQILRRADQVQTGDAVTVKLAQGELKARVEESRTEYASLTSVFTSDPS